MAGNNNDNNFSNYIWCYLENMSEKTEIKKSVCPICGKTRADWELFKGIGDKMEPLCKDCFDNFGEFLFNLFKVSVEKNEELRKEKQQGWICPKCDSVYAPWIVFCPECSRQKEYIPPAKWETSTDIKRCQTTSETN